ncbi:hypothetical protein EC988_006298 [Linderina pennispora]|nr:hypothetical protein EC988_006298 [Linderina pennispora]
MAATTTLFLFMRVLGSSIGIAILQSVLQNALKPKLTDLVAQNPQYTSQILASVNDQAAIYHSGLPDNVRTMLVHAYVLALKKVFIATVPFAAVSWLLTLPLEHIPLTPDVKFGVAE